MEPDVPYTAENWMGATSSDSSGGGGWSAWLQNIGAYGLKSAIDKEFNQPFRADPSGAYATDPYGRLYVRGTPAGGIVPVGSNALPWIIGGGVVLAVVLAVVLLKD